MNYVQQLERTVYVRFFTALHGMTARTSNEKGVCPSVRLSVCLSNACIVTKRKKVRPKFLHHTEDR